MYGWIRFWMCFVSVSVIGLAVLAGLQGCESAPEQPAKEEQNLTKEEQDSKHMAWLGVNTFEFEGHLYLTRFRGGIMHAISCPCSKGEGI